MEEKIPLLGLPPEALRKIVSQMKMPAFTAKQIAEWLYKKRVRSIDEMTNLSLRHREALKEHYTLGASDPVEAMRSVDGTVKYLYRTARGHFIEAVFIPDEDRATLCISSQVGCKMNCLFCMTGKQGFTAQLTPSEILNQVYSLPEADRLTNLVLMGMGEPMDNTDHVLQALHVFTSDWGYAWSPRRITLSSIGLKKGLQRFIEESECHLAISLHTPFPAQRAELMPVEKAFPIRDLVEMLARYDWSKQRRLSFEYILFKGKNDDTAAAKELLHLLQGLHCRINLIRFHAIPNVPLEGADMDTLIRFRDYLTGHSLFSTIRASRGEDIFAACGMLSTARKEKKTKE